MEIIFFMRAVKSRGFFEQMKGRGVRFIKPDDLKAVTPDAKAKDYFAVVGVCEQDLRGRTKIANRMFERICA